MRDPLSALASAAGIIASYTDQTGRRRRTPRGTMRALLAALDLPADTDAEAAETLAALSVERAGRSLPDWIVTTPDTPPALPMGEDRYWIVVEECGDVSEGHGPLPALPMGVHRLDSAGETCRIICAPDRLPLPPRAWGLTAPLYGLRDAATGGLPDYHDLARAGAALARHGGAFLGLNPIHAGFWGADTYSPYTPSHRRRLNTFHIPTPGADLPDTGDLLDYARLLPARRAALDDAFAKAEAVDTGRITRALLADDPILARFALHQALSDQHGPYWPDWPVGLHDPDSADTRQAAQTLIRETRFHAWLQLQAADALANAQQAMTENGARGLYLDLAVGTHPGGAETWEDPASFARGVSLGAPPDAFSAEGQSWGLAPLNPRTLVATGFRAFRETVQALFAHAGIVRIDHILGFDRAFWVPEGGGLPGAYMRMPREALFAVLRLEATRARGTVVGEDLGNVPRGIRGAMDRSGILGCRVAIFEQHGDPPQFRDTADYPASSLASFSTHDLPTWKGWRQGAEIALHEDLDHIAPAFARSEQARRESETAAFDTMTAHHRPDDTPPGSIAALTHTLGASGAALVAMQAEDVFGQTDQPNLPGTTGEHPNWRRRLPVGVEDWQDHDALADIARIMARHGRGDSR